MARWAKPAGASRKHKQAFFTTVRAADTGKSTFGIAAVEITLSDFLDDLPDVVPPSEAFLRLIMSLITSLILSPQSDTNFGGQPVQQNGLRSISRKTKESHDSPLLFSSRVY